MIVRGVIRQSRRALFTPPTPISSQICRRAFLSTDSSTTITPSQTPSSATPSSQQQPAAVDAAAHDDTPQQRLAWGTRPELDNTIARNYITMTKLQRKTKHLGSSVERHYSPGDLIRNPPYPKDITLELLMASQTHLGHNTSLWNPANSRYIHGIRSGVHIISLEQTSVHLRRAARVVEEIAYRGGIILFVGTRKGQSDMVVRAAELAGGCHLFNKWQSGTITNRDQMLAKSKMRIVNEQDSDISGDGFKAHLANRRPLIPDLVVVLNPLENFVLLRECAGATVPTIGLIDTDADPGRVTYAIPGNDDSLRSAALVAGVLGRAGELGQKRRLRDAKEGIVTWENAEDVARYMSKQNRANRGDKARAPRPQRWPLAGGKFF